MDNRNLIVVSEEQKKIEKIKKKYKNMEMSDDTASKIQKIEIANGVLSAAMMASGVITTIDLIVPDPVLGLDEIALTAITGALSFAHKSLDKHIDELAKEGSTRIKADEVNKLSSQIVDIVQGIKSRKQPPRTM